MNSGELKRAKRAVRARLRAVRDAIPPDERAALGVAVADNVLGLPEIERSRTVMAFWSFGSEVPTADLIDRLHERGVAVALPRIAAGELEPRTYVPGDAVSTTWFGAAEPVDGLVVRPTELDVVLVPGIAFDRAGRRIGYGGGYYDRFLRRTRPGALRAGICFDLQLVDEDLPAGAFDLAIDIVVTGSAVVRAESR